MFTCGAPAGARERGAESQQLHKQSPRARRSSDSELQLHIGQLSLSARAVVRCPLEETAPLLSTVSVDLFCTMMALKAMKAVSDAKSSVKE